MKYYPFIRSFKTTDDSQFLFYKAKLGKEIKTLKINFGKQAQNVC